ncbi:protein-disulfide reductase DsbD domain-containing protein [Granulicella sp. L60]|uniref:protein-disulfide reductase DsbD domain-containing protein n=1 Tax=Granulicella sp. L60 TaxID=1641866 RepID=UPI00131D1086|nr:protein-disulfide reductase DsbD domain-containing protein [Granulicella sp. L60]
MKFRQIKLGLFPALFLCGMCLAQGPIQPVQWSSAASPKGPLKPGNKIAIELSAEIQDGWHVYGFTQVAEGPTPLRVSLDENGTAQAVGPATGSAPVKKHDASFNLDTEGYSHLFSIHLPVQVKQQASKGDQSIPVSVRFQACNDRICLPPRTVHLTVPVEVLPGT